MLEVTIKSLVLGTILAASAIGYHYLSEAVQEQLAYSRAENECVAKLIPLGIERRDIITAKGMCWVAGK